ncbi:GNAT family N-acetyltransferase [Blastomonas sp. AAP53]|uniref:GNAT family N-acetyltransferase n=1 Tax=Blastomonas sp. AAP53 TaxID=1248760 RepID=UPI00030BA8F9|nr:GNAT family N-acetyltransferase [Blastomonas sp. AAP53]
MFARTQRLLLRPVWPEDAEGLFAAINDAGIVCNLARAPWPYGRDDARAFAERAQDARFPHYLLTRPDDVGQTLIGSCGLGETDGAAELGYWIARDHWGKGYATEAARAVIANAWAIGHRRLVASHYIDNPASGAVLRHLGFKPTGITRPRFSAGRGYAAMAQEYALDSDMADVERPLAA